MPEVQINGDSVEAVALALLDRVAVVEGKEFRQGGADKQWILETYAECLKAVLTAEDAI